MKSSVILKIYFEKLEKKMSFGYNLLVNISYYYNKVGDL